MSAGAIGSCAVGEIQSAFKFDIEEVKGCALDRSPNALVPGDDEAMAMAKTTPIAQNRQVIRTRGLKKADLDAIFFFMRIIQVFCSERWVLRDEF